MNIKRNIIFALEARKKNGVAITENVPIRMRVNYSGQRIEFTMPYRIDAAKWDATKQRVKNGCTNKLKVSASEINAELTRSYTLIQDIFKEFELQELMPTTEQLKDVYTSRTKVEDPKSEELIHQKTFWEIYDEFTEENGKLNEEVLSNDDQLLQNLWRTYFKAICIKERMNPRKQLNDMPRRYWKYMTEKQ